MAGGEGGDREGEGLVKPLQPNLDLAQPLIDCGLQGLNEAVRDVDVLALILHQGTQAIGVGEGSRRSLSNRERLLDAAQGDLTISLTVGGPISRKFQSGQGHGMRGVVQVVKSHLVRSAAQVCGLAKRARGRQVVFDLAPSRLVPAQLPSLHEPFEILQWHPAPPRFLPGTASDRTRPQ